MKRRSARKPVKAAATSAHGFVVAAEMKRM